MSGKYISTELLKKQFDPKTLDPLVKEARRKGYSEQDVNEARARAEEIAKIICDGIDLIPAADVEPVVRAHWFVSEYEFLTCSACGGSYYTGAESTVQAHSDLNSGHYHKRCHNCGAHMERSGSGE